MRRAAVLAITTRVVVLLVGYAAVHSLGYTPQFRLSENEVWNLPARFDAGWYLGIARQGYNWNPALQERQQNIVFFPAFPAAMRVAGEVITIPARLLDNPTLFGNGNTRVVWGGALVAMLSFIAALVLLGKLGSDEAAARRAQWLLAAYPFAFFFSAPYSEGLFLLSVVAAFLAQQRGRPGVAFAAGMLAGLTRSNGWALGIGMIAGAFTTEPRANRRAALLAALGPFCGTAAFSLYIWRLTGHPLAWSAAQRAWGRRFEPFGFLTHRLDAMASHGFLGYLRLQPADAVTSVCLLGVFWLLLLALRDRDIRGSVFALCYLVPAVLIDIPSVGRMTSVLFPAFLAAGRRLNDRQTMAIAALFMVVQLALAASFFTWHAPF